MTAYSLYENNQIIKTINKLNNFIDMNPDGEFTAYAHYLLAMSYYVQVSEKGRDPNLTQKALNYFQLIISKYPNTKYSKDAKLKIQFLKNRMAENELEIGKFYLRQKAAISAIKRFKSILENFQNTSVIPETLFRLGEALLITGLKDEANKSFAILKYNFPKNKWSSRSESMFGDNRNLNKKVGLTYKLKNYIREIFN